MNAVQDGVQLMNRYPINPENWIWKKSEALWATMDERYILLDVTQTAKNKLDTLFQEKRAYGDFKADFDHFADKAKYDNRTKVDMLRKRLSSKITSVIDNQVNLPDDEDYDGWSKMTNSIARNLQQQEHIAKIQQRPNMTQNSYQKPNQDPLDMGDPMDLSRVRLSNEDRKYRKDNNLCLACGQKGHFANDHHRKIDPIPMPKRLVSQMTPSDTYTRPQIPVSTPLPSSRYRKSQYDYTQPLPIPFMYYNTMQYPYPQFQQNMQAPYSNVSIPTRLRALGDTGPISDIFPESSSDAEVGAPTNDDQLKGKPLA